MIPLCLDEGVGLLPYSPLHVDDAVSAVGIELGDEEVRRLLAPYAPHPPGEFT